MVRVGGVGLGLGGMGGVRMGREGGREGGREKHQLDYHAEGEHRRKTRARRDGRHNICRRG